MKIFSILFLFVCSCASSPVPAPCRFTLYPVTILDEEQYEQAVHIHEGAVIQLPDGELIENEKPEIPAVIDGNHYKLTMHNASEMLGCFVELSAYYDSP